MPIEEQPAPGSHREFEVEGEQWRAEVVGHCAVGAPFSPAVIESVHLRRLDESGEAVRLAYLPRGIFASLGEDELRAILRSAPPLAPHRTQPTDPGRSR